MTTPNQSMPPSKRTKTDNGASRRNGLLSVNDLNYMLEPDLSVAVNVTHKNHFFQSNEYAHTQRGVCILNSGADYIDTRGSYLFFELKVTSTVDDVLARFGLDGSVMNIIKNVTISTRSGDEISRITDCNRLNNMINGYRYNKDWVNTTGQCIGYGEGVESGTDPNSYYFTVPLYLLSDFFGYGRLLPSMLMSGLRIEIDFETPDAAFVGMDATGAAIDSFTYKVTNPYFCLKSVQLTDATQRALNEQSAQNGLEIVYCDWEQTQARYPASQKRGHIEIRKACSRALKAFARVRHANKDNTKNYDSFASPQVLNITKYQWQLGSLYFPQQPVEEAATTIDPATIPSLGMVTEGYQHALDAFGKSGAHTEKPFIGMTETVGRVGTENQKVTVWNSWESGGLVDTTDAALMTRHHALYVPDMKLDAPAYLPVSRDANPANNIGNTSNGYSQPQRVGALGSFASCSTTLGVSLERSSLFNLAGVPINNSRVLALDIEYDPEIGSDTVNSAGLAEAAFTDDTSSIVDVYLKYVKLARVFLNNVEVEQ